MDNKKNIKNKDIIENKDNMDKMENTEDAESVENIEGTENVESTENTNSIKGKISKKIVIPFVIFGLAFVVFIFAYLGYGYLNNTTESGQIKQDDTLNNIDDNFEKKEPEIKNEADLTDLFIKDSSFEVDWLSRAEKLSQDEVDGFLDKIQPDRVSLGLCGVEDESENFYCDMAIFKAGTITSPESLKGKDLYYVYIKYAGMGAGWTRWLSFYDENYNKFVFVATSKYETDRIDDEASNWFAGLVNTSFEELNYPDEISIPNQKDQKLVRIKGLLEAPFFGDAMSNAEGAVINIEKDIKYKPFGTQEVVFVDEKMGPVFFRDGNYNLVLPNGSVQLYDLIPYFLRVVEKEATKIMYGANYEADIVWDAPDKHADSLYEPTGSFGGGCGGTYILGTNVVNNNDWFDESNLVEIGKTSKGEKVYELDNKENNEYYKNLYQIGFPTVLYNEYGDEQSNLSEDEKMAIFLNDQPSFFWKDYMGNWRIYTKTNYKSMAECGKPVIYLYPEQEMDVRVQVNPTGGFTKVEPDYPEGGWVVRANTQSSLYNYADNTTYPYLFWEGHAQAYKKPEKGFVFAKSDVPDKMRELLYKTGLNEKETEDFMEFWQDKLMVKDYVFVTFIPKTFFDKMAPLTVEPAPDKIIRVFMDYTPLDVSIEVEPIKIFTPIRKGFTVVEWGGVLYN